MPLKTKTRSAEMQGVQVLHGGTGHDDTPRIVVRGARLEPRFRFHAAESRELLDAYHRLGVLPRPPYRDRAHRCGGRDRAEALLQLPPILQPCRMEPRFARARPAQARAALRPRGRTGPACRRRHARQEDGEAHLGSGDASRSVAVDADAPRLLLRPQLGGALDHHPSAVRQAPLLRDPDPLPALPKEGEEAPARATERRAEVQSRC